MATKTYDAKQVCCIVGGAILSGFSDGDMVSIERNEDTFTLQVGTDGADYTRSKTNNRSGRFTFSLMQTSAANLALTAIAKLDELGNAGAVPILVKDINGTSVYNASVAWCVKPPAANFGREADVREWVFETGELNWAEGGN
jgi:hypothetical protein